MSEADAVLAHEDTRAALAQNEAGPEEEMDQDTFSPEKGNVVFGSAGDGWAFRLEDFAAMYAVKLKCKPTALLRGLWGDFSFQPKSGRIMKCSSSSSSVNKPMFVQFVLEPLWRVYSVCLNHPPDHATILGTLAASLGIGDRVAARSLASTDPRLAVRALLQAWLPLAKAVLGTAIEQLPSPSSAAQRRVSRLLPPRSVALRGLQPDERTEEALTAQEQALQGCDASAKPIVYVSKMVSVPATSLPGFQSSSVTEEVFLAFGRVFAGTVSTTAPLFVLPDTYNPADDACQGTVSQVTPTALYLMMGRGLETLEVCRMRSPSLFLNCLWV